jgi:hypothetical protein
VWFGRNEGVPPADHQRRTAGLAATLDGTRYYTGSSNSVNLQGSGPYNYRPPEQYFTELAQGFSVEVGTPSLASLESLRAMIPEADRWPLGDTLCVSRLAFWRQRRCGHHSWRRSRTISAKPAASRISSARRS